MFTSFYCMLENKMMNLLHIFTHVGYVYCMFIYSCSNDNNLMFTSNFVVIEAKKITHVQMYKVTLNEYVQLFFEGVFINRLKQTRVLMLSLAY